MTRKTLEEWLEQSEGEDLDWTADLAEDVLLQYAEAHALPPPEGLKQSIMDKINLLHAQQATQQRLNPARLPFLDDQANWLEWRDLVADLQPAEPYEDIYMHPLELSEKRELYVIWVKTYVPEEVHHDLLESFLILDGSCVCQITNAAGEARTVRLGEGEFITMQLGETHDIQITSEKPAKAILQWHKLAA